MDDEANASSVEEVRVTIRKKIRKPGEVWRQGEGWKIKIAAEVEVEISDLVADQNVADRLLKKVGDGVRDLACADSPMIDRVNELGQTNPHFHEVISLFRRHLLASLNTRMPIRIPHILLVGPPGVGKTHVLRALAEAIGLPFSVLDAPALSGASIFSGTDRSWKNPRPGKIAESLIQAPIASQIMMIDELDKAYQHSGETDTLAPLHALLEPSTATKWKDECLNIEIDARFLSVVATANTMESIAPSLLDRFVIFKIEKPDSSVAANIIKSIFSNLKNDFGDWFENDLDPAIIDRLRHESPRQIRKVLHQAMMNAAAHNRKTIILSDLFIPADHSRRIGFIQSR